MTDRLVPENLHAESINGVLASLDRIIDWSITTENRSGYFATLYYKVTAKVKHGIAAHQFDDGARMERLDVLFANRYLDAFEAYHQQRPISDAWKLALDTTNRWSPLVLQHLFLAMNAHINLDLGIAAADTVAREDLPKLKSDFDKINDLLANLVNEVQDELGRIWPPMKWLDKLAGRSDEKLADRAMIFAREQAWTFATKYATADDKKSVMHTRDRELLALGKAFLSSRLLHWPLFLLVRLLERGDVARKISILR